jgi:hypothetical protein
MVPDAVGRLTPPDVDSLTNEGAGAVQRRGLEQRQTGKCIEDAAADPSSRHHILTS